MSNPTKDEEELRQQQEEAILKLVQAIMEETPSPPQPPHQGQKRPSDSEGGTSSSSPSPPIPTNKANPMTVPPIQFSDLYDGAKFYYILTKVNESIFASASQVEDMSRFSDKNTVLRKSIFQTLIREMNAYAKSYLFPAATNSNSNNNNNNNNSSSHSNRGNLNAMFDVQKLALIRKPDSANVSANTSSTHHPAADSEADAADRAGRALFFELAEFFVVMVVMSGVKPLLDKVRQLDKETQLCLSNLAKHVIKRYQLEPRKPQGSRPHDSSSSSHHPLAGKDTSEMSGSGESLSIMGGATGPSSPTAEDAHANRGSSTASEPQPLSPPTAAPLPHPVAAGASTEATTVAGEDSHGIDADANRKRSQDMPSMPSMRPSTRAPSECSTLLPLPAFAPVESEAAAAAAEESRGRRKSRSASNEGPSVPARPPTWQPSTADALLAPDAYMLTHLRQLEEQVNTLQAQRQRQDAALRSVTEEKDKWRVQYQYLLEQQDKRRGGSQPPPHQDASQSPVGADDAAVAEEIEENMEFTSVDFQKRLQAKENLNEALRRRCAEQERTIAQLREDALKAEEVVATLKRKVKNTEESLIVRSEEKRDALAKLSVVEDKLLIQIRAKTEMENELEEVRSQLTILEMKMQDREDGVGLKDEMGGNHRKHDDDDDDDDLSSTDHIVVLEQQLNAVQTERDALYRRVRELAVLSQQQYQLLQANHIQLAQLTANEGAQLMEELSALTTSPSPLKREEGGGSVLGVTTPDRSAIIHSPGSAIAAVAAAVASTPVAVGAAAGCATTPTPATGAAADADASTTAALPPLQQQPLHHPQTPVSNLSALFTNNNTVLQNASTMSQAVAQQDTWKAQVRQLEKEKEEIRAQLARAQASLVLLSEQVPAPPAQTQPQLDTEQQAAAATTPVVAAAANRPMTATTTPVVTQDAKRYQAVLTCLLLRANYRNTLLQQHAALLASSSASGGTAPADAAAAARTRMLNDTPPPPPGAAGRMASSSSSFITRQRREVERGLLDSVIHNKPPPTFFEHSTRLQ